MKIFNNIDLRDQLKKAIEKRYGSGFRLVLYCDHLKASDRISIIAYAKRADFGHLLRWKRFSRV